MSLSKIFYLILLLKFAQTQVWNSPAFLPKDGEDRVECCEEAFPGQYIIRMEESIKESVVIAFLSYEGTTTPIISKFKEPPTGNRDLGASFQNTEDGKWALVITIEQDFDDKDIGFRYNFEIEIDEVKNEVFLSLINIDDESPIIQLHQSYCEIDENYEGATNCVCTITDADGIMDNIVHYQISGSEDIEGLFEFKHNAISNGMKEWDVTLHTLTSLNYEEMALYIIDFTVEDSGQNSDTARIVIRVNDLPDMPPVWQKIFSSQQIKEKESMTFDVQATDGDVTINAEVNYRLQTDHENLFSIDPETGKITINPIDRDNLKLEIFNFQLIAYEKDNDTSKTDPQTVTIVVEDINDHKPEITIDKPNIVIPEATAMTLAIKITINDPDLAAHATYSVSLGEDEFNQAFQIVPDRGYQEWSFSISVSDAELLDYENEAWREITLEIKSQEIATTESHSDTKTITVTLENWNDEEPKFEKDEYIVAVKEDIGSNQFIETVFAIDADVDDNVIHTLLGKAMETDFTIDEETGEIKTKTNNAFDYERQQIVIINVQAQDTLLLPLDSNLHTVVTQLTINVLDVNDEPPRISVPVGSISIKENQPNGMLINENFEILAIDEDTEAQLEFSINWSESSAVKNGQIVDEDEYNGCIKVSTDTTSIGRAKALLTVEEITPGNTPDYERFDTLNIVLVVEDINQTIEPKTDSVRITIIIQDENDNKPIFDDNTIISAKRVTEASEKNTFISTITASDKDGPVYNSITYSLRPADDITPTDWVDIDEKLGTLYVVGDIDADLPIETLTYIVVASDPDHSTEAEITINVIDTNNKIPELKPSFEDVVQLKENSNTGVLVQKIEAIDRDRDEVHNTPWFRFTPFVSNEVISLFAIDLETGDVIVNLIGTEILDRDSGTAEYNIPFIVGDDYRQEGIGNQHQELKSFTIKLVDENDNAPIIQTKSFSTRQDVRKDSMIGTIEAIDIDEPNHDNSKIQFKIVAIEKDDNGSKDPPQDMFYDVPDEDLSSGKTTLFTNYDLRDYYGTYHITVETNDLGTPQQKATAIIDVIIEKFNFEQPQFDFPKDGQTLYLSTNQELNRRLYDRSGNFLQPFSADDLQGGKWDMTYTIDESTNPGNIFYLNPDGRNIANLQLRIDPDYGIPHVLTIIADCSCIGSAEPTDRATITIRFIDETAEPQFSVNEARFEFSENKTGLGTFKQLPKASYNVEEEEEWDDDINYILIEDSSNCFEIDSKTANLTLTKELDREEIDEHTLVIVASRYSTGNLQPDEKSILTVDIKVLDVNDNPPNFNPKSYTGSVKQSDDLRKVIKSVQATDLDSDDSMTFTIVPNSMQNVGEIIKDIEKPFDVDETNGDIILNFSVKFNMEGYFTFKMRVADKDEQDDIADITIYVVSQSSSYTFTFENNEEFVKSKETDIAQIFGESFGYICNIEKIEKSTNDIGETLSEATDTVTHFIDDTNVPIENSVIDQRISNVEFLSSLNTKFREISLFLKISGKATVEENMEEALRAWLIGVSVVLGTLCFALIIAFIVKTRSLMERLNKLSTTEFGSQESGLNRLGVAAPNTNKHAIEGSNPVYNEEKKMPDVDTTSIGSGDSDLIGIEDNPNFYYDSEIFNGNFKPNEDTMIGHLNLNNTKY